MTHGERRKAQILEAGLTLWPNVTARSVARVCGITHQGVLYHFDNTDALCEAIATHAVRSGCKRVVPMLIVARHESTAGLTAEERSDFLKSL